MKTRVIAALVTIALALCPSIAVSEVKIGMLAQRGTETALQEWGGIAAYLTEKLGEQATIVPLKFSEFMDFCDTERSGFIFTNPWFYVRAKVLKGANALVTVKYKGSGETFGGVIFTWKGSGIEKIEDMRGKIVLVPKLSSPGGWLFQKGEIVRQGVSPERDFKLLLETEKESHDQVVYAVREGKADVGTVRTNILEAMQREGKINMSDFMIINQKQHPDFSEVCSTPLYPDWPVASLKDTPEDISRKVKEALLSIPPGHSVLEQARKLEKFVVALDYGSMEELCRFLKVPPFKR